ncbi:PREDICTED: uncharacterized protein LOC109161949 isoform X2 [Ipomoea nil]|uniref:uncharacterized protein LOC109161949 isoform X2 n=1 Tax=Ipomoea nil TaxID=35883 RepID=UPI000900BDE5|nr:PREDICTED: uncharacterized protein LOC109161949 isoform X2 [Ipomoea nil]
MKPRKPAHQAGNIKQYWVNFIDVKQDEITRISGLKGDLHKFINDGDATVFKTIGFIAQVGDSLKQINNELEKIIEDKVVLEKILREDKAVFEKVYNSCFEPFFEKILGEDKAVLEKILTENEAVLDEPQTSAQPAQPQSQFAQYVKEMAPLEKQFEKKATCVNKLMLQLFEIEEYRVDHSHKMVKVIQSISKVINVLCEARDALNKYT